MPNKPVTIHGKTYPSQKAAAAALGLRPSTICQAQRRGTLDFVGSGKKANNVKPLIYGGQLYPTQKALAAHLGISPSKLRYLILNRKIDVRKP